MTITYTPTYGLAMPQSDTALVDLATVWQQVATRIEDALTRGGIAPADVATLIATGAFTDTGWVALSPASGFTGTNTPAIRRVGKVVAMRGSIHRTAGNWGATYETAFTLPDSTWRPSVYARFLFPGFASTGGGANLVGQIPTGSSNFQIAAAGNGGSADGYLDGVTWMVA